MSTAQALDWNWTQNKTALRIVGNIESGWRRAQKTYCYRETASFDFTADYRAKITLSVFPRPSTLSTDDCSPLMVDERREVDALTLVVRSNRVEVTVPIYSEGRKLNSDLPWGLTETSKKHRLFWQLEGLPKTSQLQEGGRSRQRESVLDLLCHNGATRYDAQVLIVFTDLRTGRGRTSYSRGEGFFPGGLPSLGNRN